MEESWSVQTRIFVVPAQRRLASSRGRCHAFCETNRFWLGACTSGSSLSATSLSFAPVLLRFVSDTFKSDREIILAAVTQDLWLKPAHFLDVWSFTFSRPVLSVRTCRRTVVR